ncbi:MAG TPA: hypothetical protein VFJ67_07950, partial [Thermodesulfobacteriota bacterium]|nr:hypothetical protein [Thermodesulfobacteriota bacterium]
REGINTAYLQPRTVWPVLEDVLGFIDKCSRVYVVELNAQAQLAHILMHQGADPAKIINILKYDGIPFRPAELAKRVLEQEGRMVKKGKKEAKIQ